MENILNTGNILFLDIETIPQQPSLGHCSDEVKALWEHKAANLKKGEGESGADIYNRAGIYAEFGKIVCISTGYCHPLPEGLKLRIKSFFGNDEYKLLAEFADLLNLYFNKAESRLCAHNGKEFDFPYISRRMIINGINLPSILDTMGKKPWEVCHLDTMEMWKFGDFKSYTPLNLLANVLGVPNPKDDIDGSQVWSVYWIDNDLPRIVKYCEKDVAALANVFFRIKNLPVISPENIVLT